MPAQVPLEYDLLRDLPVPLLRNRLVLLHYFSDLLAPIVSMLPLEGEISLGKLRGILVYSAKESLFRKVSGFDSLCFNGVVDENLKFIYYRW